MGNYLLRLLMELSVSETYFCNPYPTPYHDLNRVLQEFVQSAGAILRDNFIGAYLQGSFAVGDFDLHSDVDFVVVIQNELDAAQVDALQDMHARIHSLNSRWAHHLECSYFPRDVLRRAPQTGEELWYLDNGARSLIRSVHDNILLVRFIVREQGIILAGPPPATLIDPVAPEALRSEIYENMQSVGQEILTIPPWFNNRFFQAFVVLNYCRMLHDLHRGQAGSKLAGAEWVIYNNLAPQWVGLIERSWARRTNPANWVKLPADPDDLTATIAFVQHIIALADQFMASTANEGQG
jgi:predicted nucleotidyltransferase